MLLSNKTTPEDDFDWLCPQGAYYIDVALLIDDMQTAVLDLTTTLVPYAIDHTIDGIIDRIIALQVCCGVTV